MLNCVARGGVVQAFENFGLPMNLIERFSKARSRRNYRNWRDRPLRPNLIGLVATRFLARLLVPLDS